MIQTENNTFWKAQLLGWALFAAFNAVIQTFLSLSPMLVFFNSVFAMLAGLVVTSVYRELIRRVNWLKWRINHLIIFIVFTTFLLALAWLLVNGLLFKMIAPGYQITRNEILGNLVNGSLIFLIWNLVYFFFQYFSKYHRSEIEKLKLAVEIKDAQLGTLKAQIKPHFVFNTLNNIKALILEDKHKARSMLVNFSELLRYALLHSKHELVLLKDEVEILQQYLELLSIQYEDRLSYKLEVDEVILEEKIPPMVLQLLVENGIKHGIAISQNGGELIITIYKNAEHLFIDVKNTGSLKQKSNVETSLGTGLNNIKERLKLIYGAKAKLNLTEKAPYVIASVHLPTNL